MRQGRSHGREPVRHRHGRAHRAGVGSFEGQGGPAGFGKGSAKVHLAPAAEGTDLTYTAQAQVGGKIAQVGQRLVDGVARSMAEDFFKRFDEEMQRRYPAPVAAPTVAEPAGVGAGEGPLRAEPANGLPWWAWVIVGAVVVFALLLLVR
jgi:hypothetical protein